MFKVLYNIFIECRSYILKGLSAKTLIRNKKGDLTKYFDKFIENKIITELKNKCPLKAQIISEELSKSVKINKSKSGNYNYIIIDPVDGSDNYTIKIPFVCMGISIFDDKFNPIYSFVGNYYSCDWIYADENKIVFNKKYKHNYDERNKKLLIFTFSKLKLNMKMQNLLTKFDIIRSLGATIGEMMLVAMNRAEAFIDIRGKLTFENFAPFFLIAKHTSLKLVNEKGEEIKLKNFSLTKKYKIIFTNEKNLKSIIKNV
ncbi:MAG: hypothetical protein N2114_01555 [Candidatus Goldbacteria bacterium]|nr:hypothetical protein [Candidatus Goldiibacteriota bacterium]